jgi:hypothetical protein
MKNGVPKQQFMDDVSDIAIFATANPLSIFKNLFHQRLEKHSLLKSMLEILHQFYVQMETESDNFSIFPGDLALYTLKCVRCGTSISPPGSIGEALFHAPTAILRHLNIIQPNEDTINEMMLMPLLFTSYDSYLQSSKSSRSCELHEW